MAKEMTLCRMRNGESMTAVILIIILLLPSSVWAWGRIGHQVSARMAEARLTPAALAAVHNLLGPGISLANVAKWADEQREVPRSSSWHYVDVPISEPRYNSKYCQSGGCIVSKIEDFKRVLMSPNAQRAEKQQALKFLVHLIADLHQPLHVGDTGSKGGNLVQVRFFNLGSNLHRVWDSQVIEWHSGDEAEWLKELNALATPEKVIEWSKGSLENWATESLEAAKMAYRLPGSQRAMESGTKLGEDYCQFALPIIKSQLAKAGMRVAVTLNAIFR